MSTTLMLGAVGVGVECSLRQKKILTKVSNATVLVETNRSIGSGAVLDDSGNIITCYHVIDQANGITVRFKGDTVPYVATVISTSPALDLAIIRPQMYVHKVEPLEIAPFVSELDYANLLGDHIWAVGHPAHLTWTITDGVLGQVRWDSSMPYLFWLQTNVTINPGNSGGPIVDSRGRVLGIAARTIGPRLIIQGLNIAIPGVYIKWLLTQAQKVN